MPDITLRCHRIVSGLGEGDALVSKDPICFYLTDPKSGTIRERGHQVFGSSVARKVLMFPTGKASSAVQMDGLRKLMLNNTMPNAMVITEVEPVLVSAAALLKILLVDKLEKGSFEVIKAGDHLKVDATNPIVTVTKLN